MVRKAGANNSRVVKLSSARFADVEPGLFSARNRADDPGPGPGQGPLSTANRLPDDALDGVFRRWHWDPVAQDLPGASVFLHTVWRHGTDICFDLGLAPPEAFLDGRCAVCDCDA